MGAFDNISAIKEPCVKVWRVQSFELTEQPKLNNGNFYSGDCYLVLDTHLNDAKQLKHNVHYWIGNDSTLDEQGCVAVFAVQLDDALGGAPLQLRQQQGAETAEFLQLFPRLKYLQGGYASGFKSAADGKGPPRLYQVRSPNKSCVQVFEVPCTVSSLNSGDCFLLENPAAKLLYVWHGGSANMREKMRAVEAANAFKDGTAIKAEVLDERETNSPEARDFYALLGAANAAAAAASIAPADKATPPAAVLAPPALYTVSGSGSAYSFACCMDAPGGRLSRTMLQPGAVMVLHAAGCAWVWLGQGASATAADAFKVGQAFISGYSLPRGAPIKVVRERFESGLFASCFADWTAAAEHSTAGALPPRNSFGMITATPTADATPLDLDAVVHDMRSATPAAAEVLAAGKAAAGLDGIAAKLTSSKVVVRVQAGSSAQELPGPEVGQFYDGCAYTIVHSYSTGMDVRDKRHTVYVWQGRHASATEKGAAALTAADMHHKLYAGRSTLVRVTQGLEPSHFVQLFSGKLLVRRGSRARGTAAGRSPPGTHLYQVKAESVAGAHAVEVEAMGTSLCSSDCFVLESVAPAACSITLWQGRGSAPEEQSLAVSLACMLAGAGAEGEVQVLSEGEEGGEFWTLLGGKTDYASASSRRGVAAAPRLFHLRDTSAAQGRVKVEAYDSFSQEQLDAANTDVVLLDTRSELFLWVGKQCHGAEKARGREIGMRYLQACGRSGEEVVEVQAGAEPYMFTAHFLGFDTRQVHSSALDSMAA